MMERKCGRIALIFKSAVIISRQCSMPECKSLPPRPRVIDHCLLNYRESRNQRIAVLEYIYAGETKSITAENCIAVLQLTQQWMLHSLTADCAHLMQGFAAKDNCLCFLGALMPFVQRPLPNTPLTSLYRY